MSLFMSIDCPHCMASKAPYEVTYISVLEKKSSAQGIFGSADWLIDASGTCMLCARLSVALYRVGCDERPDTNGSGDLTGRSKFQGREAIGILIKQSPQPPKPDLPEHLPDRVMRPFLEAEKAFSQGLWGSAAASYRKAVERAITPLLLSEKPVRMLGPKIGLLAKTNLLPPAMLDWIRIVKDDANFALHDDDLDFDKREDIEPAREFAFTLLTYLFTLPEKVRIARGLPKEEGEASTPAD